jgi:hypothetical protein
MYAERQKKEGDETTMDLVHFDQHIMQHALRPKPSASSSAFRVQSRRFALLLAVRS